MSIQIVVPLVTRNQRSIAKQSARELFLLLTPEARIAWWQKEVSFSELFSERLGSLEKYELEELINDWVADGSNS